MKDSIVFNRFQRAVDATTADSFKTFVAAGPSLAPKDRETAFAASPGLRLYDEALDKVLRETAETSVAAGDTPAVWFLYNMGIVVKTPRALFAIDIAHRQGVRLAPLLDFALITHNHDDHWLPDFYFKVDGAGKTVVSNFLDNYRAFRSENGNPGGYSRGKRTLRLADATIRVAPSDHNGYLKNFTSTFEISVGDWTLYHTGDSSNLAKLNPTHKPDLWFVHPRCGLDVTAAVRKFHPRRTVIGHLCELGHTKWRWTLADGLDEAAKAEAAGTEAIVPLWGQRIQ